MKEFWSIQEVADYLGVDYKTIYRLVQQAEIPAGKVGGVYRIPRQEVEAYFDRQRQVLVRQAAEITQIKCGRCLRLLAPYEVVGPCDAADCEEPLCRTCWDADPDHRCRAHILTPMDRLRRAEDQFARGELLLLLTGEQARRREFLYLSRVEAKLRSLSEVPHPDPGKRPVRVADWDAIGSRVVELDRFREGMAGIQAEPGPLPSNPRLTYRLGRGLVLEVLVYSDLASHLKRSFVVTPTSSTTLFELLSQAIGRCEGEECLTVLGLAATAGWDQEAATLVVGNDAGHRPFYHRLVAPVLVDLDLDLLIYNQADKRLDHLAGLFSPEMAMDVVQSLMSELEEMLRGERTGILQSELVEQGRAYEDEVAEAFDRLVSRGRYQIQKVGKQDRMLTRRSR